MHVRHCKPKSSELTLEIDSPRYLLHKINMAITHRLLAHFIEE